MIRKLLMVPALAGCLALAACDPSDLNPNQAGSVAQQVQDATRSICGFVPTVSTVANVIGTFAPGAQPTIAIVTQVAQGICGAITAKSARYGSRRGARAPVYRGVRIHGSFAR